MSVFAWLILFIFLLTGSNIWHGDTVGGYPIVNLLAYSIFMMSMTSFFGK